MKSKLYYILISLLILTTFIGCSQSKKEIISKPDKIIIYDKGEVKEIDKTSPNFDKIFELTENRFDNKISTAKDIINDEVITEIQDDGLGIEFIYDNEQELSMEGDGFKDFKYYKLYFQLESEQYGDSQGSTVHILQYGDKDNYKDSSRGPLKFSKKLIELVKKELDS